MAITLGFAHAQDLPGLTELWRRCFPTDEERYIHWFYKNFLLPERCPTAFAGGRPVCSCTLLEGELHRGEKRSSVFYLYALATLPEYRGAGLAGSILDLAQETAERTDRAGVILRPASQSLFPYYSAHGYRTVFRLPLYRVKDLTEQGFVLRLEAAPGREELYRLYRETMAKAPCAFLKSRALFDAVIENAEEEDGGVQRLYRNGTPLGWCLRQGENICEFYLPAGTRVPPESLGWEAMYRGPLEFPVSGVLSPILE